MKKEALVNKFEISTGNPYVLGATRGGKSVNFAVAVPDASTLTLKLCSSSAEETIILDRSYRVGSVFAVRVDNVPADFTYSYEAFGHEFEDPYATGIKGREAFGKACEKNVACYIQPDDCILKDDKAPGYRLNELIIYKLHVRGFTMDENSGVKHPGTYLGVAEKLPYLKKLGINAVLLMPCVDFDECMPEESGVPMLTDAAKVKGAFKREKQPQVNSRINYWGYGAPAAYFAPKASFAADTEKPAAELKKLIKKLHEAGIEVLMEFCFPERVTTSFVTEVCRYWVREYHLDGFRFINMPIQDFCISGDPYLAGTKLLSEGWDEQRVYLREQTPEYKILACANMDFTFAARRFLKGEEGVVTGFTELHRRNGSKVGNVNYITDTNGFTLYDLYCYDIKHNEDNGENNRDGREISFSWNCGKEGEGAGRKIETLRKTMVKNALIALLTAQGVPMLQAGDEFYNSQNGNNNAYCQDNPVGWVNWHKGKAAAELTGFVAELVALRKKHMVFHNNEPLRIMDYVSYGCPDLSYHGIKAWGPDFSYYSHSIGILYNGDYARERNGKADDGFYVIFNMDSEAHEFDLPSIHKDKKWEVVLESQPGHFGKETVEERSLTLPAKYAIILKEQ